MEHMLQNFQSNMRNKDNPVLHCGYTAESSNWIRNVDGSTEPSIVGINSTDKDEKIQPANILKFFADLRLYISRELIIAYGAGNKQHKNINNLLKDKLQHS